MTPLQNLLSRTGRPQVLLAALTLALALPTSAGAAIVVEDDVNPFDTSTWDSSTKVYVGHDYWSTGTLRIDDGSRAEVSHGYVAYLAASEATATVVGEGSAWNASERIYVGYQGDGSLRISEGALVTSRYLTLGSSPRSNGTLLIESGADVECSEFSGVGSGKDSNGAATVNGDGSTWSMSALAVGSSGTGTLSIENAGQVNCSTYGRIGSSRDSHGTATVTGSESLWQIDEELSVGRDGTGALNILDGGLVRSKQGLLGDDDRTAEGTVTVSGSGSRWEIIDELSVGGEGTGTLNIEHGGLVSAGATTHVNQLRPYDTGSKLTFDDGTLETGTLYASTADLLGVGTIRATGWVLDGDVTMSSSNLTQSIALTDSATGKNISLEIDQTGDDFGSMGAGYRTSGTLTINNGGLVKGDYGYLGYWNEAEGTVTVSGNRSTWETSNDLYIGRWGNGLLNVIDGGLVTCARIHIAPGIIGTLEIRNGGRVECSEYAELGRYPRSVGTATINGAGSTWELDSMKIGLVGIGRLNVQNGGRVKCDGSVEMGCDSGGSGSATILKSGSTWEIGGSLIIGEGNQGTINIKKGGLIKCGGTAHVGSSGGRGSVDVNGMDSTFDVGDNLHIGSSPTAGDSLRVTEGGKVKCGGTGYIGYTEGEIGVTVDGSDSKWESGGELYVGYSSFACVLNIQNGGLVKCAEETYVKRFVDGSNPDTKIVFDGGTLQTRSLLASPSSLQGIGTIETSGWVLDADVTVDTSTLQHSIAIADAATGTNIDMRVDQTGDDLGVVGAGYLGNGTLTINAGGRVRGRDGYLGYHPKSHGTATVSGSGSTWEMSNMLNVGFGGGGTLDIRDGGLVSVGGDVSVRSEDGTLIFGIGPGGGLLDVGGNVMLDGAFGVELLDGYMPRVGDEFTLIEADGASGITGLSHQDMMAALPALAGALYWQSDYTEGSPALTISVVPEPGSISLLLCGLLVGLTWLRRRR